MKNEIIPLSQIVKRFNIPYVTVYRWIRSGKLPAKKNASIFRPDEWFINLDDWYEIPTFIRNRYKLKKQHGNNNK